jgi:hypothetical protein
MYVQDGWPLKRGSEVFLKAHSTFIYNNHMLTFAYAFIAKYQA